MKKLIVILLVLLPLFVRAQVITTVAGGGAGGDGSLATAAQVYCPQYMAFDSHNNLYFTENLGHKVRRIDSLGIIETIAGTGIAGFTGDGGLAIYAQVNQPSGIAVDTSGNVFFCDGANNRVRKINTATGIINTVAGGSVPGFAGDGNPATSSLLNDPYGLFFDKISNSVLLADNANHRIRKINSLGIITTIAGNGIQATGGDGGQATNAPCQPVAMCMDSHRNLFFVDGEYTIRKISADGIISTIAGDTSSYFYNGDNIPATNATFGAVDIAIMNTAETGEILYISSYVNNRIRFIDGIGIIHTIAGNGVAGDIGDGGPATAAELNWSTGLAFDNCGNLFVAQVSDPRIRKIAFNPLCPEPAVSLQTKVAENSAIYIYPNPVYEQLQIDNITTLTNYNLHNIVGATLQQGTLKAGSNSISLSALPTGMYLLELIDDEGHRVVRKVVKE